MKLECYVVRDLLPGYIEGLVNDKTKADIEAHLNSCENCNLEYNNFKTSFIDYELSRTENFKEVDYLKKFNKKYFSLKKSLIAIVVTSIILLICLITTFYKAYSIQYNDNAISHYLNITINTEKGIEYFGSFNNYQLYTYQLEEAYFIDFNDNHINLKDALESKLITLNEMTSFLTKKESNDNNLQVYEFENYQIIFSDNNCIVAPLSVPLSEVTRSF
ncbi:zf-HC2 domain-containing protein [Candidatus Galacturonibacter soehngenii]|uniref:Zf-HC2 domain-containing protein n=1 Tax=Candidatus Galacturonatibacter soehngenii TaxID=2307010 RepID=A0A7V7QMA8_9FIRM|nr:zf-HC2 domain-containing protein [Candidatus Galacturonibacter soehngenii]KAB1439779.1 zf-HC2 domain-containing protein [Candidatus Galacturonibacter soehngenii]